MQYSFTADQRAQLAELLADENNSIWAAVLYGISATDEEIVAVVLSQIGNVGANPIGHGMALTLAWSGVPVLYPGAPTSAAILKMALSHCSLGVPMARSGSMSATSGRITPLSHPPA